MAKKKLDKSKYQPTHADVDALWATLEQYVATCKESSRLMQEKGTEKLEVPNWNSAIKALRHVDNLVRSITAAAAFGQTNPLINQLLEKAGSEEEDEGASLSEATRARKKRPT